MGQMTVDGVNFVEDGQKYMYMYNTHMQAVGFGIIYRMTTLPIYEFSL